MQKQVLFLYTDSEHSENEIKKRIPFIIELKIIKYLHLRGIINSYTEN
jgi:hypothetical protein